MRRLNLLRHRLRSIFRRRAVDDELRREIELHVEQLTRELRASGLSEREARRAARLEFGSASAVADACRDTRRVGLLEEAIADSRYAWRILRRSPGFTTTAVLSLALGLGANSAIFSLVDAVLLRSLAVRAPHELVFVDVVGSAGAGGYPYPVFEQMRSDTTAFAGIAAFTGDDLRIEIDGQLEQVYGQVASGNYFELLGVAPVIGRLLTPADDQPGSQVAVIGHGYWQRRFGGAADVLGRTIAYRGLAYTIVGVAPASFTGLVPGRRIDLTLPISIEGPLLANRGTVWFDTVGRLRPGVSVEEATAQTMAIFQSFMNAAGPPMNELRSQYFERVMLRPAARGVDRLRSQFGPPLYALALLAGVVLAITCANLASLLLARGAARGRELAIRLAAGAGRMRLVRQLLTETLWLFAFGAVASVGVAYLSSQAIARFFAIGRSPILLDVRLDWRLLGLSTLVALAAGLATALWPAIRALRADPSAGMKSGDTRIAGPARVGFSGRWLVTSQVALSLVLLVAAALFVRTTTNLRGMDMGFRERRILTMSLDPVLSGPTADAARSHFWDAALDRVRALPGVRSASLSILTPLSGRSVGRFVSVAGQPPRQGVEHMVTLNQVSDDYFETFGIDLVAGRTFTRQDGEATPLVAIINQRAAAFHFGRRNPLGERLDFNDGKAREIVGVVRDTTHMRLRDEMPLFAYLPLRQRLDGVTRISLAVSSSQPAAVLARSVGHTVRQAHPRTAITDVMPVDEQIDANTIGERLLATLAAAFAVLALGLSAIGLYGTLSYSVERRKKEFGVRMALGARRARVALGVIREVQPQVAIGIAIGLGAAVLLARYADRLLFGVSPTDPWTYLMVVTVLGAVATLASWLPAHRAASIDPVQTLRRD
jgi:predicted permease